ncbi:MAG: DUF4115 domain-containing protein [Ectothiorhodospiraceae bacterium]|nr:DUF4115 domain-containing protein [Ectothiorhodospiraceae bacterium]
MSKKWKKQPVSQQNAETAITGEAAVEICPGDRLKKAREAHELSVHEVATRLKLSVLKIEALERGDVQSVATPVFVAGYLRTYARLLQLSEEVVLADFSILLAENSDNAGVDTSCLLSSKPGGVVAHGVVGGAGNAVVSGINSTLNPLSSHAPDEPPTAMAPWLVKGLIAIALVGAAYFVLFAGEDTDKSSDLVSSVATSAHQTATVQTPQSIRQGLVGAELMADSDPMEMSNESESVVNTTSLISSSTSDVAVDQGPNNNESSVATAISTAPAEPRNGSVTPDDRSTNNLTANGQGIAVNNTQETAQARVQEFTAQSELALFFTADSWVEVNDARGERLVYRLGKAGMARTVTGVPPFEVQLGYVPAVDVMYNGAPFDLSRFAGRRSARFSVGTAGDRMGDG